MLPNPQSPKEIHARHLRKVDEMYRAGLTLGQMALRSGLPAHRIKAIMRELGLEFTEGRPKSKGKPNG